MSTKKEQKWGFWFLLPIYPYQKRATVRKEVVPNSIWIFDQPHGFLYAVVPIRMTVVKLKQGGLLVYCPVAPTPECIRLVRELEASHGKVKYIIHSTSSGLEHKVFVGPFARCFPTAGVWYVPTQWSFPLNLPLSWLGFPPKRTYVLPQDWRQAPFAEDFEYHLIDLDLSAGSFAEVALFHRESQTLLVTDAALQIPPSPPEIFNLDPFPLLFHARETALEDLADTPANRRQGWRRICLFALYFRPSMLETIDLVRLFRDAIKAPDRSRRNYFGLYPFRWQNNWLKSFKAIADTQIPIVAPILQTLILPQDRQRVADWVNNICEWQFQQVIAAHFASPFKATPIQFKQAFTFLEEDGNDKYRQGIVYLDGKQEIVSRDSTFIKELESTLVKLKIATPAPKVDSQKLLK